MERLVIVLVEPLYPGNVGAVARAMKNFGLSRLVLVNPPAFDPHRARWNAPGCDDIIAGIRVVPTLEEALVGVDRAIAATARHRRGGQGVLGPSEAARAILADDDRVTALLFGREDNGLPIDAVERCEAILRIPTPEHASLNLGQAVLLCAWAIFDEARRTGQLDASGRPVGGRSVSSTASLEPEDIRADLPSLEPIVAEGVQVLTQAGYMAGVMPEKVALTLRRALQRAGFSRREIGALRGMLRSVRESLR